MLELHFTDGRILAVSNGTTVELNRTTGDWTRNVVRNYLDSFGVEYIESGVLYNKDAVIDLYVMPNLDGSVSLGLNSINTDDWLELEGFDNKVYAFFMALGGK